jgi:PEP-CTERM motif-containing protein
MKLKTSRLRPSALAWAAGAAAAMAFGTASAQTTFSGFTNGCFGTACTPTSTSAPTTISFNTLSFTNSTFSVTSSGGSAPIGQEPGTPNFNNLGSMTLAGSPFTYPGNTFRLLVTFTAPPGTAPPTSTFTASFSGMPVTTNNGGIFIDFDNTPQNFTFGSGATAGSFNFFVNDVSLTAGHTIALSGQIRDIVTSVPEPETYALFLAGLGAVGFMVRRRKS